MPPTLALTGSLYFVAALLLPAFQGTDFLKIGGPGWKVFYLSMALLGLGFVALFKETNEKVFIYFLPGLLNILVVLLMVLGLLSVHGSGMKLLGGITLLSWGFIAFLMIFRMRNGLKIGGYVWCIACVLLSLNAIQS